MHRKLLFNIATFKPEVKRKLPLLSCFTFYWTYLPEVCIFYEDLLLFNILQVFSSAVMVVLLILGDYQLETAIFSGGVVQAHFFFEVSW
jgi:hypothetical protein